ncbi:MAG: peptidoglycan-binding domain-containing protein [Candidatus Xenobia bacterium]
MLRNGSSGQDVKTLQERLNQQGAHLKVDGMFGPQTQAAVRQAQRADHLQADGIAGPQTLGALGLGNQPHPSGTPNPPPSSTPSPTPATGSQGQSHGPIHNQTDFARQLLQRMGAPVTDANVKSLTRWEQREGGHWNNTAQFNPLNTSMPMAGSHTRNRAGVKAYSSWDQGLEATAKTINLPAYRDIATGLMSGHGLSHGYYRGLRTWSAGSYASI